MCIRDRLKGKVQLLAGKLEEWQQNGTLDRIAQQFDQGLARGAELASQGFQWLQENGDTLLARLKMCIRDRASSTARMRCCRMPPL